MKTVLVANPKGGSGKSTLATSLAAHFAWQGERVMLGDLDKQHSARRWLALRPQAYPAIAGWELGDGVARPPKHTTAAVLDSPAGFSGKLLERALKVATHIVVPVQPAAFDLWALEAFFKRLAEIKAVRKGKVDVSVVGMRVRANTQVCRQFLAFLHEHDLPLATQIRDTQGYAQLQPRGLTIFDLPARRVARDLEQWAPLLARLT
ncbi:ParA family protein [Chitinibacteraceae bacterium HSL-7]